MDPTLHEANQLILDENNHSETELKQKGCRFHLLTAASNDYHRHGFLFSLSSPRDIEANLHK